MVYIVCPPMWVFSLLPPSIKNRVTKKYLDAGKDRINKNIKNKDLSSDLQKHKVWCFYPGGRGSDDPELGACCCLGLAPSIVPGVLLLLLPQPPPDAFTSPNAGEGEEVDEDEEAGLLVLPCADEDGALKEAAPVAPSEGLAAEEEPAGCMEAGRV